MRRKADQLAEPNSLICDFDILSQIIAPYKSRYPDITFLISPLKRTLWRFIRSASSEILLMSTTTCFCADVSKNEPAHNKTYSKTRATSED